MGAGVRGGGGGVKGEGVGETIPFGPSGPMGGGGACWAKIGPRFGIVFSFSFIHI